MSLSQYSTPKIWGPHFWFMLRCMAHNYPIKPTSEDAKHIKIFFSELQYLLPCELCKYTFKQHYAKHPIEKGLLSKTNLVEWVETIYQETAKVIQDKRIRIMDISEPSILESQGLNEIKPIKTAHKSKVDPLEEQLNIIRKNIMNKEFANRAIPVPSLAQINEAKQLIALKKTPLTQINETKQSIVPKKQLIPEKTPPIPNGDKINITKKIDTDIFRNTDSIVFKNPNEFVISQGLDKINSGTKLANKTINTSRKTPGQNHLPVPIVASKSPIPIMSWQEINPIPTKQLIKSQGLKQIPIALEQPAVNMKLPIQTPPKSPLITIPIPIQNSTGQLPITKPSMIVQSKPYTPIPIKVPIYTMNQISHSDKALMLTRRCHRCEH